MVTDIISASVRGASHKLAGKKLQDSRKSLVLGDIMILAAADGHGSESCPYSKSGSTIAVNVFCGLMSEYCSNYADNIENLMTYFNREGDTSVARAIEAEWKRRVEAVHRKHKRKKPIDAAGKICKPDIWKQYGTTLLGLLITPCFYFAFQIGDGDILLLRNKSVEYAVTSDKLLGTETYSLSLNEAWRTTAAAVGRIPLGRKGSQPVFMMATDGFANSYPSESVFLKACAGYYSAIRKHGVAAVAKKLKIWLNETSTMGSGDDITVLFAV